MPEQLAYFQAVRASLPVSSVALAALLLAGCVFAPSRDSVDAGEWPSYGNDPGGTRFSPLPQIDRSNVANLHVAWTYRTGETGGVAPYSHTAFEATPLMVDGTLILSTPYDRVIALDPETGKERWSYDPKVDRGRRFAIVTSRGVATWLDASAAADSACRRSVFVATIDARLIALDAATGAVCSRFGRNGQVDLTEGIRIGSDCGCYQVTSPPVVIGDLVIVGSSIGDNRAVNLERGVVRAYDVKTGTPRWSWDPIPTRETDPARSTWADDSWRRTGGANVWSVMSVDATRGLVFLPTSSPSPDHYGGERLGANQYADSVVALKAATGEVAWHFQVVHHDLWDYDVPACVRRRRRNQLAESIARHIALHRPTGHRAPNGHTHSSAKGTTQCHLRRSQQSDDGRC
jgi:quinoprotein glucose dehydrogenase